LKYKRAGERDEQDVERYQPKGETDQPVFFFPIGSGQAGDQRQDL